MTYSQSDWIFNIGLKLALIICLTTLVIGLTMGVGPITAMLGSSVAFTVFTVLGWAASLVWEEPAPEKRNDDNNEVVASQSNAGSAGKDSRKGPSQYAHNSPQWSRPERLMGPECNGDFS
jgi:hypothetical protein